MNSLSFLIYLAEISRNIGVFFGFGIVACVVLTAAFCVLYCSSSGTRNYQGPFPKEELEENAANMKIATKYMKIFFIMTIVFGILESIIPSRETVLLIAASEISEKIINTPEVKNVIDPSVDLLKSWITLQNIEIKNQIESTLKSSTKNKNTSN